MNIRFIYKYKISDSKCLPNHMIQNKLRKIPNKKSIENRDLSLLATLFLKRLKMIYSHAIHRRQIGDSILSNVSKIGQVNLLTLMNILTK